MNIQIPYGKELVSAQIPDESLMLVAKPKGKIRPLEDEDHEIRAAFASPIGTEPLWKLAEKLAPDDKVVILTSDYTRPTPTAKLTKYALEELKKGGISPEQVTVVFCSGLHRPMTDEEMCDILGDQAHLVKRHSHDAYHDECIPMGMSKNGTPIEISKIVAEAKLKVSFSTVEPHHAAGWSGGGKNVIPGVSSKNSVFIHHRQMLDDRTRIGVFDGNPFREDIDDIAQKVKVDFICNVILTDDKQISMICCGDVIKAHRAIAAHCEELVSVLVEQLPDIVIGGPGGTPRDNNFWQTEGKTLTRISRAVKPGGVIIVVAKCGEGVGQDQLAEFINKNLVPGADLQQIISDVREKPFTVQLNKIGRISKAVLRNKLFIVCDKILQDAFVTPPFRFFDTLQEAADEALAEMGKEAKILVVPETTRVLLKLPQE